MPPVWVGVTFNVGGDTQIARGLEMAAAWSEDLHDPLSEMMDLIVEDVRAQFDSEGAQGAMGHWQPLSDIYGKWKAQHWPGRPILVRTGGMKGAMLNKEIAVRVGADAATYEPKSHIAGYHQFGPRDWDGPAWGHRIGGGKGRPYKLYPHHLPQRKMVDLSDAFKHEAVDRTFARWIQRKLKESMAASRGGAPPLGLGGVG